LHGTLFSTGAAIFHKAGYNAGRDVTGATDRNDAGLAILFSQSIGIFAGIPASSTLQQRGLRLPPLTDH
jgi:hypothetical protein